MSDTDSGSFDKEAEREKLRQQLEEEEQNRASTAHMSELLLKGATMTNKHCDDCKDPIFRFEGREFCPTCEKTVGEVEEADETGAQRPEAGEQATTTEAESTADGPQRQREATAAVQRQARQAVERTAPMPTDGELADVRGHLVAQLIRLATRLETVEDVGRTRTLFAAIEDGAEAIEALDRLSR